MPNIPARPGSGFDVKGTAFVVFVLGSLVVGHALGFMIGVPVAALVALTFYFIAQMPPREMVESIKLHGGLGLLVAAGFMFLWAAYPPVDAWGGQGTQLYFCALYCGVALAGLPVVWKGYKRFQESDDAAPTPFPGSGAVPSPAVPPIAPPAADPPHAPVDDGFTFDADRFAAARPPPRASRFVPLIEKFNIDLSSDDDAYRFAQGLVLSARAHMLKTLDEEIEDPATAPEVRRFLRQVRAHLTGERPGGESAPALGHDGRRRIEDQSRKS